jgi:hypothetical protein
MPTLNPIKRAAERESPGCACNKGAKTQLNKTNKTYRRGLIAIEAK